MDLGLIQANTYHPHLQELMKPAQIFKALVGKPVLIYSGSM